MRDTGMTDQCCNSAKPYYVTKSLNNIDKAHRDREDDVKRLCELQEKVLASLIFARSQVEECNGKEYISIIGRIRIAQDQIFKIMDNNLLEDMTQLAVSLRVNTYDSDSYPSKMEIKE